VKKCDIILPSENSKKLQGDGFWGRRVAEEYRKVII